jgi:hypothetical protein
LRALAGVLGVGERAQPRIALLVDLACASASSWSRDLPSSAAACASDAARSSFSGGGSGSDMGGGGSKPDRYGGEARRFKGWCNVCPAVPAGAEAFDSNGKPTMRTSARHNGGTMKIQWLAFWLLATASGGVAAAWSVLGNTEGGADIYIDRATLSKSGHTVKVWIMEDYKGGPARFSGRTFQSAKLQHEYDCKDPSGARFNRRFIQRRRATEPWSIRARQPTAWRPINAGTVAETLWKMACGKK